LANLITFLANEHFKHRCAIFKCMHCYFSLHM
jgi:hypothetical protein